MKLPEVLLKPKRPLVVGLWVSPDRLVQVRRTRLSSMGEERSTDYVDLESVRAEIAATRKLFEQHECRPSTFRAARSKKPPRR